MVLLYTEAFSEVLAEKKFHISLKNAFKVIHENLYYVVKTFYFSLFITMQIDMIYV